MTTEAPIDPILLEVLWNRLITVVNEQAATLVRASFSTVVSEAEDLAAAVFDVEGRMLAQAVRGTPGHINSTAQCIRQLLVKIPGEAMDPGDVFITNDPWKTSGHLNDLTVMTPIFRDGEPVAFFANTCHAVDISGRPMSAEAKDVFEEGLWLPILKLFRRGHPNEDLFEIIETNVRSPREVIGDLHAQVAGNEVGGRELLRFMEDFRLESLQPLAEQILTRSEQGVREAIAACPEGVYRHRLVADGFDEPVEIRVKVTVADGGMWIGYDGTSPQSRYGINVVLNYTYAYSLFAILAMLAPELPNNAGSFRPVAVTAPPGCILNALPPAPVAARHSLGQLLPSAIFGALAEALPDRVLAEGYDADWGIQPYGKDGRGEWVSSHLVWTGGTGARPTKDGISAMGFPARSQAVPVEVVEDRTPLVFLGKELRPDSAGAGRHRGGAGQTVTFRIDSQDPFLISPKCERIRHPARGLFGGQTGAQGEFHQGDEQPNPKQDFWLMPKETVTLHLPGGGGYGDPLERVAGQVLRDVQNGIVTLDAARQVYGVALKGEGKGGLEVDWEETKRLRESAGQ